MPEWSIAITGARSYVGRRLVGWLLDNTAAHLTCFASLRDGGAAAEHSTDRVTWINADFSKPLSGQSAARIGAADCVVHLAWERSGAADEIVAANQTMLERVLGAMRDSRRLCFLSSVAADSRAPAAYGRAKHACARRVEGAGGTNIVCGLIIGRPPQGGFKTFHAVICRTPLSYRFSSSHARAYPIAEQEAVAALGRLASTPLPGGSYGLFIPGGMALDSFVRATEDWCPRRRFPVPVPARLLRAALRLICATPARRAAEKAATFFWKNDAYLQSLPLVPGVTGSATRALLPGWDSTVDPDV